jgi:hypothetical protein
LEAKNSKYSCVKGADWRQRYVRRELDKEIGNLRKETDDIQNKLDIVKACNAQFIEQKFDNMLEQSKFQDELFEDLFCSRNVI